MSCLTELYFSSTGVRLEIVNVLSLAARSWPEATPGSAEPGIRSRPGPAIVAAVQTVSLVQEPSEERMIPRALRFGDLPLHFLPPLLAPAVDQSVEGLQEPDLPGGNPPFYHYFRQSGNRPVIPLQSEPHRREVRGDAGS